MQVYKSKYADAYFDKEKKLFSLIWNDPKHRMREEDFKQIVLDYINIIIELKPELFLLDAYSIYFPVEPDLQMWMSQNSLAKTRDIIRKEAIVVKNDVIMYLSAEQTIEIELSENTERKIFHENNSALEWLLLK